MLVINKFTKKQLRFISEYMICLNASEAARKAGYSIKTAESQGTRLLQHVRVREEIEERYADQQKASEITIDKIKKELAKVAFLPPEDFIIWYGRGCKITLSEKLKAIELLCRVMGIFSEKREVSFEGMSKDEVKARLVKWLEANETDRSRIPSAP